MQNSCIRSVEITLKYFQVIDLIASFLWKINIERCLNLGIENGLKRE